MADLICFMSDCKYISKKPYRKYVGFKCSKVYGCTLPYTSITLMSDPDGEIKEMVVRENMAHCAYYRPYKKEGFPDENL